MLPGKSAGSICSILRFESDINSYLLARGVEIQRAWLRKTAYYKIIDYYRLQNRCRVVSLEYVAEMLYEDEALSPGYQPSKGEQWPIQHHFRFCG